MKKTRSHNMVTTISIRHKEKAVGLISLLLLVLLAMMSAQALAHKGATGVVKGRMEIMDEIGNHMKGMKAMVQRKQPFDAEKMARHAESIRQAATNIKKVFPEGSLKHPSEALPNVWEDWDEFSSLVDKLITESEKLREIATSQDQRAVMKQFGRVGKTCSACHTDFRKKKDKKK